MWCIVRVRILCSSMYDLCAFHRATEIIHCDNMCVCVSGIRFVIVNLSISTSAMDIDMLKPLLSISRFCSAPRVEEEDGSPSFLTRSWYLWSPFGGDSLAFTSLSHRFSDLGMGCLGYISLSTFRCWLSKQSSSQEWWRVCLVYLEWKWTIDL